MTDVLKIELMQMMENAGRNLARLAIKRFLNDPRRKRVVVLAGTGGNGGRCDGGSSATSSVGRRCVRLDHQARREILRSSGASTCNPASAWRCQLIMHRYQNDSHNPRLDSRRSDRVQPQRRPTRPLGRFDFLGEQFRFADTGFGRSLWFGFNFGIAALPNHRCSRFNDFGNAESWFQFDASQVGHGRTVRGPILAFQIGSTVKLASNENWGVCFEKTIL